MKDGKNSPRYELWIEKLSKITGFEKLGKKLTGKSGFGPYVYFFILFSFTHVLWTTSIYYKQNELYPGNFLTILIIVGLAFGIWSMRRLRDKYKETVEKMGLTRFNGSFNCMASRNVKISFFILAVLIFSIYQIFHFHENIPRSPYIMIIIFFVLMQIYTVPIIAEFTSIIYAIHITLPNKLSKIKIDFNCSDPSGKMGAEPIGDLILLSSKIYFVGISLFTLNLLQAVFIHPYIEVGLLSYIFIFSGWIFGFVLFFVPQMKIHKLLKEQKREKIREIYKGLEVIRIDEEEKADAPLHNLNNILRYVYTYLKLDMINKQSEYPFDFEKFQSLLSIAIIPLLLLFLQLILSKLF